MSKNRASSRLNTWSACFDVSRRVGWSDNAIRCVTNNERVFVGEFSLPWLSEGRSNMVWSKSRLTVYFADTRRFFLSFLSIELKEMMNLDYSLASIDSIYLQRKEIVRRETKKASNSEWKDSSLFSVLDSMFYYEPTRDEEEKGEIEDEEGKCSYSFPSSSSKFVWFSFSSRVDASTAKLFSSPSDEGKILFFTIEIHKYWHSMCKNKRKKNFASGMCRKKRRLSWSSIWDTVSRGYYCSTAGEHGLVVMNFRNPSHT